MNFKKIFILVCLSLCILSLFAKSNKPLTDAIIQGDLQKVERIIGRGADINFSDNFYGYSPLMCAVIYNNNKKEIIQVLLKAKADVNALDRNGNSALYHAIYHRVDIDIIESLINNGADINIKINDRSPLMYVIEYNNKALFDILLNAKASVNVQDSNGYTPLIYAVKNRKKEIVEALLNAKADVNAKDKGGNSGLYYAFYNDNPDIIELLINNGADINIYISGYSPLIYALIYSKSKKEIIEALIKAKADVNATDNEGRTPLMWALIQKDKDIIKVLLDEKANVNVVDKSGNSVLYYALDNKDLEDIELLINKGLDIKNTNKSPLSYLFFQYYQINPNKNIKEVYPIIELLLKKGANVNEKVYVYPQEGTLLMAACIKSDVEIVKLLLKYGADVNITNETNSNALHYTSNKEIGWLLIKAGINIHLVNNFGWTPLFASIGEPEILSELIKRKAKVNIKNEEGETPLMLALKSYSYYDIESLKILLDAGASVNEKDKYGITILEQAIRYPGRFDIIKLLIDKGAKVDCWALAVERREEIFNYLLNNYKFTSEELGLASFDLLQLDMLNKGLISTKTLSYVKSLLKKGADINKYLYTDSRLGFNETPSTHLLLAIKSNNFEAVKLLLDYGAEINDYIFSFAEKCGNNEIIELLRNGENIWDYVAKGNIDKINEYCKTKYIDIKSIYNDHSLLFHTIFNNQVEAAKLLIKAGIDLKAIDGYWERNALHFAAMENNYAITKMLLDAKMDPNVKDVCGNTPYSLANVRGFKSIVELLLKYGAKKSEHYRESAL